MNLNAHKTGLALGAFMGFMHLIWSLLVALGLAKPWVEFIWGLHFFEFSYTLKPFNIGTALLLIVVTTVIGYVVGWIFSSIWNRLQK